MVGYLFHPPVTDFPIALWITALLFDLLYAWRPAELYRSMATWLVALGLVAAPVAIATAFYDVARLQREGVGAAFLARHTAHSLLAYAATGLYAANLILRLKAPRAHRWTLALSALGAGLLVLVGYFGNQVRQVM
ncbi:MAG: DUF2231 domain-containing protein [Armatimonadota bacterium]|nr:hypothetical protein [Armatimonadota bacterium]MDW8156587.1 DUF2231 domain-containing protein [Armatimonadota bacterium]